MSEQIAYWVFLSIVVGGLAIVAAGLVAVVVFLVRQNRRARADAAARRANDTGGDA